MCKCCAARPPAPASNQAASTPQPLAASRLGVRGSEDLGVGLSVFFTLETGINLDDGTSGQGAFWGRQSLVGLATPYGQVLLGRQYGSLYSRPAPR